MAAAEIQSYLDLIPDLMRSPQKCVSVSYDVEADVLYISFGKPGMATDSEITEEDVIIRYEHDEVIGLTVLHASRRGSTAS